MFCIKVHKIEKEKQITYFSAMQLLIVPDSFKESLPAIEVASAIKKGVKQVNDTLSVKCLPFSDGGEGALTVLDNHAKGKRISCQTVTSIGQAITADYFLFEDQSTAWIELSQASGLSLLKESERHLSITSTYGTGLQIKHAIAHGCSKIILGIGGSATNDAGAGIFQALGGQLLDENGNELAKGGAALIALDKIILPEGLNKIQWEIACDVENPLLGPKGASTVYGPQKGGNENEIKALEKSLEHFANITFKQFERRIYDVPGGGAAGGTAAGMIAFFNAQLIPGFDLMAHLLALEQYIQKADLIFTAEGKIDAQSLEGKVPVGVARLAKKHLTPCIGLVGAIEGPVAPLYEVGFSGIFSIQNGPMSLSASKSNTALLLEETAARVLAYHQNIHSL